VKENWGKRGKGGGGEDDQLKRGLGDSKSGFRRIKMRTVAHRRALTNGRNKDKKDDWGGSERVRGEKTLALQSCLQRLPQSN